MFSDSQLVRPAGWLCYGPRQTESGHRLWNAILHCRITGEQVF